MLVFEYDKATTTIATEITKPNSPNKKFKNRELPASSFKPQLIRNKGHSF